MFVTAALMITVAANAVILNEALGSRPLCFEGVSSVLTSRGRPALGTFLLSTG